MAEAKDTDLKTANADGYYTLKDDATGEEHQFFVNKGDTYPAAASFSAGDSPVDTARKNAGLDIEDKAAQPATADEPAPKQAKGQAGPSETR